MSSVIYLCQHSQLEKGVMASPLHIQGEEGAHLHVYLLSVQNSCIPSLIYLSAFRTCSDPSKCGFWGTTFLRELGALAGTHKGGREKPVNGLLQEYG